MTAIASRDQEGAFEPPQRWTSSSGGHHLNRVFDHVYLVNLEHEAGRRLRASAQLKRYDIAFSLVTATNGYKGDVHERYVRYASTPPGSLRRFASYNEMELRRGSKFIESAGAYGYIDTYLRILADAKRCGHRRVLIVEDDVILHPRFDELFDRLVARVPEDWKILQLGASQYNWASVDEVAALDSGYYFPRSLDTCGSFAIGVDSSVYDEIIEAQSAFEAPFDHLPMGEIYERHLGSCFVAFPNLVMPDVSESTIRGGRDQVQHGKRMKWRVADYVHPLPPPSVAIQLTSPTNARFLDDLLGDPSLPCTLNAYVSTEDGIRPVHSREYFDLPGNSSIRRAPALELPVADAYAWMAPDEVLKESDVRGFLEGMLLSRTLPPALQPISGGHRRIVKGRASVVIPTYARAVNLEAALRSVACQNYPDVQVVVVSDNEPASEAASRTRSVVHSIALDHPQVEIVFVQHTRNRNGAAARNTGVLASDGEYISFLDDDDVYLPGRIASAVAELQRQPERVGAVYCGFRGWNAPREDVRRYKPGDLTRDLLMLEYTNHYLHTSTATYRRGAFWAVNGFDETFRRHQDLEFNLRFFRKYEMGVVRHIGVQLNPQPSAVSNKMFNLEFLELKTKFLSAFAQEIQAMGCEAAEVYDRHWDEVLRYAQNRSEVVAQLREIKDNGALQLVLRMASVHLE